MKDLYLPIRISLLPEFPMEIYTIITILDNKKKIILFTNAPIMSCTYAIIV